MSTPNGVVTAASGALKSLQDKILRNFSRARAQAIVQSHLYECQPLEPRRLLATLIVNGTTNEDVCVLEVDDFFIFAHMNGPAIPQPVGLWDDVQINLFDGEDVVVIRNTRDEPVDIFLGSGEDTVTVAETSKDLDNISGRVKVHAGLDNVQDLLEIYDEYDAGADSYQILEGASQPMRLRKNNGSDKVHWGERNLLTKIFINNSDNTITVDSSVSMSGEDEGVSVIGDWDSLNPNTSRDTLSFHGFISGNATFTFSPGEGDDSMSISVSPFINGGSPKITFSGGDGADGMTIDGDVFSGANGGTPTIRYNGGTFDGDDFLDFVDPLNTPIYEFDALAPGPPTLLFRASSTLLRGKLEFPGVESFHLDSTSTTQGSEFRFAEMPERVNLNISAGGGDDIFRLGYFSTGVHYGIEFNATLSGDAGDDSTIIDDNAAVDHTHTLTGGIYDTGNLGQIDIRTEHVEFLLGSGNDSFTVSGSLLFDDVSIEGFAGSDTFTITPDSGAQINVDGGTTTGDALNLVANGARGGVFTPGGSAGSGTYTFENRDPVVIIGMESFPIAPAPPLSPDLAAANDSGLSSTDNITNQLNLTFTGIGAASNSFVRLYRGGTQIATTTSSGSVYTFTNIAFPAGDATFAMTAAYDSPGTGLTSVQSLATNVRVDTIAPAVPSVPDLQAGSDSGISNSDNITNDNTPTFTVTGSELIRLLAGATVVADYASPPAVTASTLADGTRLMTARSIDLAGNLSASSSSLSVVIDTVAPASPTVAPDLDPNSDTGISNSDNVTRDNTPTFTGAAPGNHIVRLFSSGVEAGFVQVPIAGTTYSVTSSNLTDGNRSMTTRFEDIAGNTSASFSPSLTVQIDTIAPTLTDSGFNFLTSQDLRFTFSEDVGGGIRVSNFSLKDLTNNVNIPNSSLAMSYVPRTATITFPGFANSVLSDADWQMKVDGDVEDIAGNNFAGTLFNFFFLSGDANRDRRVNLQDFNILAANFGQTNLNFSQGNFNYDTIVNLQDFNILASRFGAALAAVDTSLLNDQWARWRTSDDRNDLLDWAGTEQP